MPDERNTLEIMQKALHWLIAFEECGTEVLHRELKGFWSSEIKSDVAAFKALLANMTSKESALFIDTPIHILSNLAASRLLYLLDHKSLSNSVDIDLDEATEAELLVLILKGIAGKADSIVMKFNKEKEGENESTS